MDADGLAAHLVTLAADRPRVLVGIAGVPGAGKSTLAEAVATAVAARGLPVVVVPMDGFHLADAALARLGRLDVKGAIDTFDGAGYVALLERIRAGGETVWAPAFERELEQPVAGSIGIAEDVRVVLTEGNYLLVPDAPWNRVRSVLDEAWFVEGDDELRRRRLVERHIRFGKSSSAAEQWVRRVDERNAALIAPTARFADRVVHAE